MDADSEREVPLAAEFMTVNQLAERIRIHPHKIHGWISRGKLGPKNGLRRLRKTRRWLIHWESFKKHLVIETVKR